MLEVGRDCYVDVFCKPVRHFHPKRACCLPDQKLRACKRVMPVRDIAVHTICLVCFSVLLTPVAELTCVALQWPNASQA